MNVDSYGNVFGFESNVSVPLSDNAKQPRARMLGLAGTTTFLANAGFGWDVGQAAFLLNGGVQIPYARLGADYFPSNSKVEAFVEANTYSQLPATPFDLACNEFANLETPAGALANIAAMFFGAFAVGDLYTPGSGISNGALGNLNLVQNFDAYVDGKTCFVPPDLAPS